MKTYPDLFMRLIGNSGVCLDKGCWPWLGKKDREGYGRLNVYIPGLKAIVIVQAHLAMYVVLEADPKTADEFWLAYLELRHSDIEIDHKCVVAHCICPIHHQPVTREINEQLKHQRKKHAHPIQNHQRRDPAGGSQGVQGAAGAARHAHHGGAGRRRCSGQRGAVAQLG